ncbi:ParB/RepB/Spo0J family partition protein [Kitasatospora sp. NPDC058478]|uniref:ParB/RepB/Spo0J family partition protein n=1 Tax=unclassified Kitasatospora TaxID=2633591 RepID=UPI00365AB45B
MGTTPGLGGRSLGAARSQQQQILNRQPTAPVDDLFPSPTNGRKKLRNIESLAETITSDNLSTALTVVPTAVYVQHYKDLQPKYAAAAENAGKPYVVLGGHRRLAAAKMAGLEKVPINVMLDIKSLRITSLQENMQRESLTPVEEAVEFDLVMKEEGLSQRALVKRLGAEQNKRISQTYISQRLALLRLIPDLQNAVDDEWSGERETGIKLKFAAEVLAKVDHDVQGRFYRGELSRDDVIALARGESGKGNAKPRAGDTNTGAMPRSAPAGVAQDDCAAITASSQGTQDGAVVAAAVLEQLTTDEQLAVVDGSLPWPEAEERAVERRQTDTSVGEDGVQGDCAAITDDAQVAEMPAQRGSKADSDAGTEPHVESESARTPDRTLVLSGNPEDVAQAVFDALTASELESVRTLLASLSA